MRSRILFFILLTAFFTLLIISCDNITDPDLVEDPTTPSGYQLIWSDEFDQDALDSDNWGFDLGYGMDGWGNDEWQLYTNEGDNVRVEDGNMVISALCPSGNPGKRDDSVTSARVNTKNKFSFKYGKIQSRIKAPTDAGMWPAFWMLGTTFDTAGWPQCGEIDIMEISPLLHGETTTMSTMHWWDESYDGYNTYGTSYDVGESLSDDYHVYEVEWDEQRVIGKIDDITYYTKVLDPATMSEFLQNFFLIFNVAVGGNLGGSPDDTTQWPQQMLVDWVRVYQTEESLIPIETFGIYTDETEVDAGLTIGVNSNIYVWENTLNGASIPPYEGENVISWSTAGVGWFGGGISSDIPVDLSDFEAGVIKFMIKIPADVTFKIGINDAVGNESYVQFPANQTAYGLDRDGEWGQAVIPVQEIKGSVDLQMVSYEFMILEEGGAQCEFALDDIYWDGGGATVSSVSFDADSYNVELATAEIDIVDEGAAGTTVTAAVDNGTETINIDITLDAEGEGTGILNFGVTDDGTDTIAIAEGDLLTVNYTDSNGMNKTDSANIVGDPVESNAFGIFTDLTPVYDALIIDENANIWVWENTLDAGTIPPYEGEGVLSWQTNGSAWFGAGIQSTSALDLSSFSTGNMKFMIKIPADITFKIKILDTDNGESFVQFTGNQTLFGLERNGEWGQAIIPVTAFQGSANLTILSYEFIIVQESGAQCEFAVDDIYWDNDSVDPPPPTGAAGIYSESHTETMIPYAQIINSADWSGNSVVPDEESTAVTPVDGTYVLSANFETGSAGWGGIAFDFGSQDISSMDKLILSIDKSALPALTHLGIKLEDNAGGNMEVDMAAYTPETSGNWSKYEIPLSQFSAVNLADLKYLGLWNPQDSGSNLIFGTIYFDDIHLTD